VEVVDPRRLVRAGHELELEGRQEISAPMPGKVVRVMVEQGKPVETGQGILVLEAMKMQNEVRSPKSGMLERLLVQEGQAVNAGETLAVVA
jgi:biotin carboxyl carrier protein